MMDWIKAHRWAVSLLHLIEMWIFYIPGMLLTRTPWGGFVAVVAWYWSRKETETRALLAPGHLLSVWNKGLFPWQWAPELLIDFLVPVAGSFLATVLLLTL